MGERVTILAYIEDGERIVLLATNGMDERPPAWWLNLRTTPDAIVDLPGGRLEMRAHEAEGEERERLWATWLECHEELEPERAALERRIAVVVLEPRRA